MQLRNSRLCLDCEEVHDAQQCPLCASETFVFITRWVPAPDRRQKPRTGEPPPAPETLDTYREILSQGHQNSSAGWRFVKGGALGLALFGIAGWMWRQNSRGEGTDSNDTNPNRRADDRRRKGAIGPDDGSNKSFG